MSESSTDKVKETIQKAKEAPVSSAIGGLISGFRKAFSFIPGIGEKARNISNVRESRKGEAKDQWDSEGVRSTTLTTRSQISDILDGNQLIAGVSMEKAPCGMVTPEGKTIDEGDYIGTVKLKPGTTVGDHQAFETAFNNNARGFGRSKPVVRILKGIAKYVAAPVAAGFAGITTGSIISNFLYNFGAPAFLSTVKSLSFGGVLSGAFSFTGVGAAVLTAIGAGYVGYKVGKYLMNLVPSDKAEWRYATGTHSNNLNAKTLKSVVSKKDGIFMANHTLNLPAALPSGSTITQEGDITLGRDIQAQDIGTMVENPAGAAAVQIPGFYGADGTLYTGTDLVRAGTIIPHGTKWTNEVNGHAPTIEAGSKYSEIKSYKDDVLKEGYVSESIKIDAENGTKIPAPLHLSTGTALPFAYTDIRDPNNPRNVAAGKFSRPGAVVNVQVLPKGTVIPAGAYIRHQVVSEGAHDVNTTTQLIIPTKGYELPHTTRIRRDISLGGSGILIPKNAKDLIEIPGQKPQSVNELTGDEMTLGGKTYKKYMGVNGSVLAGSRFPAESILPPRAKLTKHSICVRGADRREDMFPVGQRFTRDIACKADVDLQKLTTDHAEVFSSVDKLRLRLGDAIPGNLNQIPTFIDPNNPGTIYYTGQPLPDGVCIPATDISGNSMIIPTGMVIPGGSEIYDASRRVTTPENAATLVSKALAAIKARKAIDMIATGLNPDQYKGDLHGLPEVSAALAEVDEKAKQQIEEEIEKKMLVVAKEHLKGVKIAIGGVAAADLASDAVDHNYLATIKALPEVDLCMAAINELNNTEEAGKLTVALQKAMIDRIGVILENNLIRTGLVTYFAAPSAGDPPNTALNNLNAAGTLTNKKKFLLAHKETVKKIQQDIIPQLTDVTLEEEVREYGQKIKKNVNDSIESVINTLSQS